MATTFTHVTSWFCDIFDPVIQHGQKIPNGLDGEADTGKEWARWVVTVKLHRDGAGLTAYTPLVSTTRTGNEIVFVNGPDSLSALSTLTFKCIENPITVLAPGIWRESITWQFESVWFQQVVSVEPSPF